MTLFTVVCVLVLLLSRKFLLKKFKLLKIDTPANLWKLKMEINLLTASGIIRLVANILGYFILPEHNIFNQPDRYYPHSQCL